MNNNSKLRSSQNRLKIVDKGVLTSAIAGTSYATYTFPSVVALSNGELLATCRVGSTKDNEDETIELYRSIDVGNSWNKETELFPNTLVNGIKGSLKICYLTELEDGHLIAACMWVNRQTYQGKPLFNEDTEGCLPMSILLSDSYDSGKTWTPLREIPMPDDIGPASLTNPIMKLEDGILAMSIETNKHYLDSTKWYQRVVMFHSADGGKNWEEPITIAEDRSGKIFNWDLRASVAYDGRLVAFIWTYNSEINKYLNIKRLISNDNGKAWSQHKDIGFADQPSHPAILLDGRIVLAWVDRFGSRSIKARVASAIDQPFEDNTEVILYTQKGETFTTESTGELLGEMGIWNFGLPYAEVLPNGEVMVLYYAGEEVKNIYWVKLKLGN